MTSSKYTIEFDGVKGLYNLSEFSDAAIETTLKRVEKRHGKLPRDERTNFPSFTVYEWGQEIGGG